MPEDDNRSAPPGATLTEQGPMVQRETAVRAGVDRLLDDPEAVDCVNRLRFIAHNKPKTQEELLAWGEAEDRRRQADLAGVSSAKDLRAVQDAAAERRKVAGLTRGQALHWIREAQARRRRP